MRRNFIETLCPTYSRGSMKTRVHGPTIYDLDVDVGTTIDSVFMTS